MPPLALEAAPPDTELARHLHALPQPRRGAIAVALAAGSAILAAWAFRSGLPNVGFLFLYVPVTSIAAYLGGRRPGLVTALVGLGAAWYFLSPPRHALTPVSENVPFLLLVGAAGALVAEFVVRVREAEVAARGLALIVESSDDAIFSKALDGTILTWNAGAQRLYGYTAAEMIGRPVSTLAPPDRANEVPAILARLRRGERVDHYESVRVRKDGTRVDVALTISPVKDEVGRIVGAATIARDITERKRAEQALRRRKEDDEVINAIATKTAGETQLNRLLAVALEELRRRVTFTGGSIALMEGEQLVVRAAIGPFAEAALGQRMQRGHGRIWGIVETGAPLLCNDLVLENVKATTPIRSYLGVPLVWQWRVFGVLEVDSAEVGTFEQADLELLQRVAAVISGSIELARRYAAEATAKAEAEAARQETAALYEGERRARSDTELAVSRARSLQALTAALSGALTVTDVARTCAKQGAAAVGARASIVSLPDASGDWLGIVAYTGYRPEDIAPWLRCRMDSQVPLADCVRSGQPIFLETPDAIGGAYPGFTQEHLRRLGDAAWISLPFVMSAQTIGTLFLAFARERPLVDEERRLAVTIVQQCAQALDRARLYEAERNAREEAERAADRTGRLQEMTAALAAALTPAAVAEVIVDQGVVALRAKAGSLALLAGDGASLELVRAIGYPHEFVERWRRTPLSTRLAAWAAIRRREPVFLETPDALLAGDGVPEEPVGILPEGGAGAVIPITVGRDVIGILSFLFPAPRSFSGDDRAFVQTIARQCAQALERARLYEREHRVAATLQRALLPADLPQLPGIAIHAAYVPGASESDVGGDWYDAFPLPNGCVAVCVGDVVGRGLNAAVVMGQLRQTIRAAALQGCDPSNVLLQASKVLEWTAGGGGMATALFGILDPENLIFSYAVAGHPAPLAAREGRAFLIEGPGGLPLGIADAPPPPAQAISLTPATLLVLYTDGLIELTRDLVKGERDLVAAAAAEQLEPSADAARGILGRLLQHRQASDDIAVVTLSISATAMAELAFALPAEPRAVRVVRQAFRRLALALKVDPARAAVFEVALGEAVNNVVEHAYRATKGNVQVRVGRQGTELVAETEDRGQWRPERNENRGYGLRIIRALVDSAEVTRTSAGTVLRLAMSLQDRAEDK